MIYIDPLDRASTPWDSSQSLERNLEEGLYKNDWGRVFTAIILGATHSSSYQNGAIPALHKAIADHAPHIALALLELGCDPNIQAIAHDAVTPLHVAVSARDPITIRNLLQHKADPNMRDASGSTPIHGAACGTEYESARALLNSGAEINALNNAGETPLHNALKFDADYKMLRILVDAGADVNQRDNSGLSCLELAKRTSHAAHAAIQESKRMSVGQSHDRNTQ